jgi:5-methylcytosine-specific restriction endonuclease McrA
VDKTLPPYTPLSPELDEKIPVNRGGDPYQFENLQLTHRKCNRQKSDKMPLSLVSVPIENIPHSQAW